MNSKIIFNSFEKLIAERLGALLVIVVLGFFTHSFMVTDSFKTLDDNFSIVNNDLVKDARHIPEILTSSYFGRNAYWRPLVMLSYLAEVQAFGLNPFYFYLTNITLHLCSSIFVYLIAGLFFERRSIAFAAGLLFAVHPIHWEAVSNISGRAILLSTLFYFASFYFFVLFDRARSRWGYLGASLACFGLSLMSKESAMMLPVLVTIYLWLFKKEKGMRLKEFHPVLAFFALLAGYLLLRRALGIVNIFFITSLKHSALCFFTFLRSLLTHIRCFVYPHDLHFDRSMAVYTSFADARLWLTFFIFVMAVAVLIHQRGKLSPAAKFFVAWFFLDLFPVSQVLVSIGTQLGRISTAEHFLYSASVGIFTLAAASLAWLYEKNAHTKAVSPPVLKFVYAAALIFLLLSTIKQNIFASNELAMLKESLRYNPDNIRILDSYGFALAKEKRFDEAEQFFRKILEINPEHARSRISLGKVLCDQGRCAEGMLEYEKIHDADEFAELLEQNKKATFAIVLKEYTSLLEREPENPRVHYSMGIVYAKTGRLNEAADAFKRAIALEPQFKEAVFNLANICEGLGEKERARELYTQVLSMPGATKELDDYTASRLQELP